MEKSLVEKNIEKIQELQEAKQSEINKVKNQRTKAIGRKVIDISKEEIKAKVEVVSKGFDEFIGDLEDKVDAYIKENQKKVYQDYYAAELQPTIEQIRVAEELVKEFESSKALRGDREAEFKNQINFHLDNETVKAMPYLLANKELFPSDPNQEAYTSKLNPLLEEKIKAITLSNADSNQFEIYKIEQLAKTKGASLSIDERVSLKNRAFELGGNGNLLEFKNE